MEYKVLDSQTNSADAIRETLICMPTNEGTLLLGNFALSIKVKKINDKKVKVKSLEIRRHSTELGDLEPKNYVDRQYLKKVAKTLLEFDKRDETVKVSFSKEAEEFIERYAIPEQLELN